MCEGMAAVTNPLVNSYKRLVPGYEAPCYLAWSASNRSALIRIPAARGQSTRVELRSPDPSCNPYLAFAVCLAAGLDGIEKGPHPAGGDHREHLRHGRRRPESHGIESLPDSLEEAIHALEADQLVWTPWGSMWPPTTSRARGRSGTSTAPASSSWEREKYITLY